MSDLLAPVLCEIKNESETFWCFVGLMQRAFFVATPTDNDIDKNLVSIFLFHILFQSSYFQWSEKKIYADIQSCYNLILIKFCERLCRVTYVS